MNARPLSNAAGWSRVHALACLALALASGCGHDAADREYYEALRGEETGMTREQQIAHLDQAIRLAPRRSYYYETRAVYWIDLLQFDRAIRDLDTDIELSPRPYAYFLRGLATCQAGRPERAIADFDRAIYGHSANTQFYRGRSLARAATGDAAGALEDAEHLVKAVPQQGESHYARGVALALLGRHREAVESFDRAAGIRPELVYVVEARASSLDRLGEAARARADREAAARLREERSGWAVCLDPFRY